MSDEALCESIDILFITLFSNASSDDVHGDLLLINHVEHAIPLQHLYTIKATERTDQRFALCFRLMCELTNAVPNGPLYPAILNSADRLDCSVGELDVPVAH